MFAEVGFAAVLEVQLDVGEQIGPIALDGEEVVRAALDEALGEFCLGEPRVADDEELGDIRKIVGFHIRLAYGTAYRHFMETFSDLKLTQKQVSALWLVDDHPGIYQSGLANLIRMDRATTMAIVKRLEARGYVARTRSRTDRRKLALNLTAAGREALTAAKQAIGEHERWLKSRFTGKEVQTLIELLARIHE